MIPQLNNIDLNFLRRIFDNNTQIDVPVELFKTFLSMSDNEVSEVVNELGLFFEFDETLDIDGTEEDNTKEICKQIEQGTYSERYVNAVFFRLMFWDKAGINAYQAGYIAPGCNGVFHQPNIGLRNRKSRQLAFLLRHDVEYVFDEHGWRDVENLILHHGFTMPLLENIVVTNNKQRYEFNDDHTKIRARQGHSIKVDVELPIVTPPDVLYHGTSTDSVSDIMSEGLKPGTRLHVHLSADVDTAIKVGRRHGIPSVLKVDTKAMTTDGITFYLSNNGVWLTEYVNPVYISLIEI